MSKTNILFSSIIKSISYCSKSSENSLKERYLFKLFANFIGLAFGIIIQVIIPRGLGPKSYGDFNFLSTFFTQAVSFFDMGTSTCFYTKLSQRPKESSLVSFYLFYFTGFISILMILFVAIADSLSFKTKLWPDQEASYIYMGAAFGIIAWITTVLGQIADAYGITVTAEIVRIVQKVVSLFVIMSLYLFYQLNLETFFYYNYLMFFFLCIAFIWAIIHKGYSLKLNWKLSTEHIKKYIEEFYHYSHPLFLYALVGLIAGILDRWLLQVFAGSLQQGFYSLSYQIGAVCFLFTSAMTPLLMREFSIAFGNKDLGKMAYLFRRYVPMLYFIAAYFACFIAFQAEKVIYIFGGNKYKEAAMAVTIMAFFPIHQTYGQLGSSEFYATGQTRLQRNIGVLFMLIGLPVTYFLIAPVDRWGLNARATGLAIKMVTLQFIGVNVQLYFNARYLKFSFWKYLGHQIFVIVCLLVIATGATIAGNKILTIWGSENVVSGFLFSGVLYTLMVITLIYFLPIFMGLKKQDIQSLAHKMRKYIK